MFGGLGRLWVRAGGEWFGPYPNARWNNILAFARIGSQHDGPREVWFGGTRPTRRVRRYARGERTFPADVTAERRQAERRRMTGSARFSFRHETRRGPPTAVTFHKGTPQEKVVVFHRKRKRIAAKRGHA